MNFLKTIRFHIKKYFIFKKFKFHFCVYLTEHCNLNCQMCNTFSPIAEPAYYNVEHYEIDCEKLSKLLKKRTELWCKVLDVQRHIIQRNIEKGLLPNYVDGGIEMDKQYSTIGILGLFEVIEAFGYSRKDEFGNIYYPDEGIEFAS